jgi:type II secretory pathway pseudopilin PulG
MKKARQSGYTLLEALVTLFIIAEILIAVLVLFDFNSRVGRAQTQVAEMQQSTRIGTSAIARLLRSAGRGPLPKGALPAGIAIEVWNNVAAGTEIVPGWANSPIVATGTDVLIIRGVISNPLYFPQPQPGGSNLFGGTRFMLTPLSAPGLPLNPSTGLPYTVWQPPEALLEAAGLGPGSPAPAAHPEVLLAAAASDASLVQIFELNSSTTAEISPAPYELQVGIDGSVNLAAYRARLDAYYVGRGVNPPPSISEALHIGILEEYRIFVRRPAGGFAPDGGTDAARDSPRLAMARVYPFTDIPHRNDPNNLSIDLAENIFDLQVAFGIDIDSNGRIDENPGNTNDDEWLLNHPQDVANPPVRGGSPVDWNTRRLLFARVSTLAMTDRPDLSYLAPIQASLEDRTYLDSDSVTVEETVNDDFQRRFRRRVLQTLIEMRTL